jgi:hypothetical protein
MPSAPAKSASGQYPPHLSAMASMPGVRTRQRRKHDVRVRFGFLGIILRRARREQLREPALLENCAHLAIARRSGDDPIDVAMPQVLQK